jgi:hypothetical protein
MIVSGPRSAGQERGRESAVQSKWHSTHDGDANAADHIYTWAKCSVAMTALWRHGKELFLFTKLTLEDLKMCVALCVICIYDGEVSECASANDKGSSLAETSLRRGIGRAVRCAGTTPLGFFLVLASAPGVARSSALCRAGSSAYYEHLGLLKPSYPYQICGL